MTVFFVRSCLFFLFAPCLLFVLSVFSVGSIPSLFFDSAAYGGGLTRRKVNGYLLRRLFVSFALLLSLKSD